MALTRKLADGTYYAYFPFASLTEESKMTPYHKKVKFGLIIPNITYAIKPVTIILKS